MTNRFQQALEAGVPHSMTLVYTDGSVVTVDNTQDVLGALLAISRGPLGGAPTPELIVEVVCRYFDVSLADIQSGNRKLDFVIPRHIACYLCRELCGKTHTLMQMSKAIQGPHRAAHTHVIHGHKQTRNLLETDKRYPAFIQDIRHTIFTLLQNQP